MAYSEEQGNEDVIEALNKLILTNKDGEEGYRMAADKVGNPQLKSLFSSYAQQRANFTNELQTQVIQMRGEPQDRGSMQGKVYHAWMNLKETIAKGDEHAVLEDCEQGEDAACEAYEEVLEEEDLPFTVIDVVRRQYDEILRAHEQIHELRETA